MRVKAMAGSGTGDQDGQDAEAVAVISYLREHWADLTDGRQMPQMGPHPSDLLVEFSRLLRIHGRLQAARRLGAALNRPSDSVVDRASALLEVLDDLAG